MSDKAPTTSDHAAGLGRLRTFVWVLGGTMILGLIILVGLAVMTFFRAREPALPAEITLPGGETARAFTAGTNWNAVVTRDKSGVERIHILEPSSGAIQQTVVIGASPK